MACEPFRFSRVVKAFRVFAIIFTTTALLAALSLIPFAYGWSRGYDSGRSIGFGAAIQSMYDSCKIGQIVFREKDVVYFCARQNKL